MNLIQTEIEPQISENSFSPALKGLDRGLTIRALVSYDGTDYAGWQRQSVDSADSRPTLQATLEKAVSQVFAKEIKVQSSGRTDAGAHSEGQNFHFYLPHTFCFERLKKMNLIRSFNALTPDSISIKKMWLAPPGFHALKSCTKKTYRYAIHNGPVSDPLIFRYSYWFRKTLNLNRLNELTQCLIGVHDFKSFQTSGTELKTTIRQVESITWTKKGELLFMHITGNGFLKQMVRNIVGTTIYLHQNQKGPEEMLRILESKDRQQAKATAPSKGLFLESVFYPPELDNRCREL